MNRQQSRRPDLMAVLGLRGYRITTPRRMIAGLMERKREGFTAEMLCEELPSVGRATVFRTINLFVEVGALCKLSPMDGASTYILCRVGHHHHTVCIRCGLVEDVRSGTVERLLRAIGDDLPGKVVGHSIELYVDCKKCPLDRENCPLGREN